MDEGVKNQEKELEEINREKVNIKENSQPKIIQITEGSTRLDKVFKTVDKHERIKKTAQRNDERQKEFLKNKKEKHLPHIMKEGDHLLDELNQHIKYFKGVDILAYYNQGERTFVERQPTEKWRPEKHSSKSANWRRRA